MELDNKNDEAYLRHVVGEGVIHLNEHVPSWWNYIVPNDLEMKSTMTCVVGQVCSNPNIQITQEMKDYWWGMGFDLDDDALQTTHAEDGWVRLRELWIEAIEHAKFEAGE